MTARKIIYMTFIILVILGGICYYKMYYNTPSDKSNASAQTIALPDNTVAYLQDSIYYGNFFNENQKFVIYFNQDEGQYPHSFLKKLDEIKQNSEIGTKYVFLPRLKKLTLETPQEKQEDENFIKLCRQFCIINPQTEELFYIDDINESDTQELQSIFQALLQW